MPSYRYRCQRCGEEMTRFHTISNYRPTTLCRCGGTATRAFGRVSAHTDWNAPIKSNALMVHPSQVEAEKERLRRHGHNIEFDDGRPILKNWREQQAVAKLCGFDVD